MKPSDDKLTIMIFRGTTANPLKICLRKATIKRVFLAAGVLLAVQVGVLAHYVVQTNQVAELEGLREELSQSRGQTVEFSEAIDEMQQRISTIQALSEKLQVMFGLEPEQLEGIEIEAQGGEEVPYGAYSNGVLRTSWKDAESIAEDLSGESSDDPLAAMVTKIRAGLSGLDRQALRQQRILDRLEKTAGERVGRWASTPSIWPLKGPITSKFGPRISPFTGKKAFHSGLDIGAPRGKEVRSPARGKVVAAAYDARMGNFIRINHRYGIETTYGHLSKIFVRYGQEVKRGDVLGLVGSTGRFSTGPHLHYQVAVNDKVVDPLQYILD